jgi:hypothetical protein
MISIVLFNIIAIVACKNSLEGDNLSGATIKGQIISPSKILFIKLNLEIYFNT